MTIEELSVKISGDISGLQKSMTQANEQLGGLAEAAAGAAGPAGLGALFGAMTLSQIASKALEWVTEELTQAFDEAVTKVQEFAQEVVTNGEKLSYMTDVTQLVARNVGITSTQLDKMTESLRGVEIHGSDAELMLRRLATSGLLNYADSLTRTNALTGETITGVGALGNAMQDLLVASGQTDISAGIGTLTQFIRTGRAGMGTGTGGVNDILSTTKLTQYYKEQADAIGKDVTKVSELEKAQWRMNYVMDQSKKDLGAYALGLQKAGSLGEITKGVWEDITADLGKSLAPILDSAAVGFYQLSYDIRAALQGSLPAVTSWANNVAGLIVGAFRMLGRLLEMLPGVGQYFHSLATLTMQPLAAMNSMTTSTDELGDALTAVGDNAATAKKQMEQLAAFDEMNVLKQTDTSGTGGGMGGNNNYNPALGNMDLGFDPEKINSIADDFVKAFTTEISSKDLMNLILTAMFPMAGLTNWVVQSVFNTDWGAVDKALKSTLGMGIGDVFLTAMFPTLGLANKILSDAGLNIFTEGANGIVQTATRMGGAVVGEVVAMAKGVTDQLIILDAAEEPLTKKMADNMIDNVHKMRDESITAINKHTQDTIDKLTYLHDTAGVLTDDQYKKMTDTTKKDGADQVQAQNDIAQKIEDKITSIKNSGVTVTTEMREQITTQMNMLRDNTVVALTDDATKSTAILEKLKVEGGKISAEQAADAIAKSMEVRDATINDANSKYDATIEKLVDLRDNSHTITAQQFDDMAAQALTDKNNTIFMAQQKHDGVTKEVSAMAGDNIKQVDTMTGKTKSQFQVWLDGIGTSIGDWWTNTKTDLGKKWDSLNQQIKDNLKLIGDNWSYFWNNTFPNAISGAWSSVTNGLKSLINGIILKINNFLLQIEVFVVQANVALASVHMPQVNISLRPIPYLAQGGVINSPTVAMLGESGPEAVMPLRNNTGWIDELASKLGDKTGGSVNLTVQIGGEKIYEKLIDYVNEKTMTTNSQILKI